VISESLGINSAIFSVIVPFKLSKRLFVELILNMKKKNLSNQKMAELPDITKKTK
jgi:hypothetical protein